MRLYGLLLTGQLAANVKCPLAQEEGVCQVAFGPANRSRLGTVTLKGHTDPGKQLPAKRIHEPAGPIQERHPLMHL